MGITVSHTNYAPISLISASIGFVSFAFTLGTFLKVFWSNLGTFAAAPQEINDFLSNLKQGLLEQRRNLRRSRRRLNSIKRDRNHGPGARSGSEDDYGRGYSSNGGKRRHRPSRGGRGAGASARKGMHFDRDIQSLRSTGEEDALRTLRVIIRDLIKSFRDIEQPFLKPEYQQLDSVHWNKDYSSQSPYYPEKHPQSSAQKPISDDDSPSASHMRATNRLGHEYKKCGFKERWLWVKRKAEVVNLSSALSRVEVRRTAHEVGEVLSMVCNIGKDLEDMQYGMQALEGRLSRVVGVRRVD
ncbi:hypothetical protein DE146DRAFT_758372 [Phaeosphaeria sp. MPI-PUGE-AT-0046c]|nr:hypothetical protein DE146DRAFT_758372 [Phaeosphaeria sp. MPI-PUGE-AT-0046c]